MQHRSNFHQEFKSDKNQLQSSILCRPIVTAEYSTVVGWFLHSDPVSDLNSRWKLGHRLTMMKKRKIASGLFSVSCTRLFQNFLSRFKQVPNIYLSHFKFQKYSAIENRFLIIKSEMKSIGNRNR